MVKKRDKTKAKKPIKWGRVTAVNKRSVAIYVILRFSCNRADDCSAYQGQL
ncbi:MAG: hypothetical protein L6V93_08940 [Clostridiales bacterium]|nr:MAG: hypothetical protein L6V93_08940 [Clostridiales bacterium]